MKKTAVIILNYKSWEDTLVEAKNVVETQGVAWNDIVIVDNCSPNDSYEQLSKSASLGYILIKSDTNAGYATGNNIGLRYAFNKEYDYALILNNDIIIEDNKLLEKCIEVFDKDSQIATVNPDIYSSSGHMFNRDRVRPTFFDLTIGMLLYIKKGRQIADKGGYGLVYRPQGCCMLLDLKKANEVEYLDEETFLYCEEIIYAERLLRKGYLCACCSNTFVIHNHSKTVRSSIQRKQIIDINQNSFEYYLKKYRNFGRIKRKMCLFFNYIKLQLLG